MYWKDYLGWCIVGGTSQVAQWSACPVQEMQEMQVWSLSQEGPLE